MHLKEGLVYNYLCTLSNVMSVITALLQKYFSYQRVFACLTDLLQCKKFSQGFRTIVTILCIK